MANDQVCINCDSILNNPDFCLHCGLQFERKPGAAAGATNDGQVTAKKQQSMIIQQTSFMDGAKVEEEEPEAVMTSPSVIPKQKDISGEKSISLKQRISNEYTFSGRERKVCKKCSEVNPFFKNECQKCNFKFPKTRGLHNSSLSSDNYTLYFWDMLHSEPLFSSLNRLNDFVRIVILIHAYSLKKEISCV